MYGRPPLQKIIQGLKSTTTRECWRYNKQNKIWQRTYYEHIIRNEKEYLKIYKYIEENPIKWKYDKYNNRKEKVMNEKNKSVEKAKKILEEISSDERERYLAELRQKYIMDQKAVADAGYDKGVEQGIKQGREQGEKNKQLEIAKKLKEMNMSLSDIEKATGLTVEEIESL